jgi:DNA-binding response OmpR family regulator
MLVADWLDELGYEVVGPVGCTADALPLLDSPGLNAVLLDVTLRSGDSFAIADAAGRKGVRIAFITGRDASEIPERLKGASVLPKPFEFERLKAFMSELLQKPSAPAE